MNHKIGKILFSLVILSLLLKLAGINHQLPPQDGDTCIYMSLAKTVFTDRPFYSATNSYIHKFDNTPPIHPDGNYAPLFPILLALFYKIFGFGLYYSAYLASLLAALCVVPAYLIGRRLFNEESGLMAGLFVALEPTLNRAAIMGLSEPLYVLSVLFSLYFAIMTFSKKGCVSLVLSGLFTGLAYLTRSQGLTLFLVLCIAYFFKEARLRKKITDICLFAFIFLTAASPWLIRNYVCFKNPLFNMPALWAFTSLDKSPCAIQPYELNLCNFLKYNGITRAIGLYVNCLYSYIWWHIKILYLILPFSLYVILTGFKYKREFWVLYLAALSNIAVIFMGLCVNERYAVLSVIFMAIFGIGYLTSSFLTTQKRPFLRLNYFLLSFSLFFMVVFYIYPEYRNIYKLRPPFFERYNGYIFFNDIGKWFKENTPKNAIIMTTHPAAINFYSDRTVFICHGKNDAAESEEEMEIVDSIVNKYNITYFLDFTLEGKTPKGFSLVHTFEKPLYYNNRVYEKVRIFKRG